MTMDPMEHMIQYGFSVWPGIVDEKTLYALSYHKEDYNYPQRGHDRNGKYYNKYHESVEWANYWTNPLNDNPHVIEIRKTVDPLVGRFLVEPVFYHADISVLTDVCRYVRPHIDTPHRHAPWNRRYETSLGIQVAIPMHHFSLHAGSTAFVPGSHLEHWDIKRCYNGEYTDEFLRRCVQPEVSFGSILMWDSRTLHSHMPNTSNTSRFMLLFNYLERRIVSDVMEYEASLCA